MCDIVALLDRDAVSSLRMLRGLRGLGEGVRRGRGVDFVGHGGGVVWVRIDVIARRFGWVSRSGGFNDI